MNYGDGITHFVSYEPKHMDKDWVTSACGQRVHIREFSAEPTCQDRRCKAAALRHKLLLMREKM